MRAWLVPALLVVALLVAASSAYQLRPLRLNSDGTFKILFLTDLHFGEGDAKDKTTAANIQALVDREDPDFVVLGGDTFSNYADTGPKPNKPRSWVEARWNLAVKHLVNRVQWATIFGNHDFSDLAPWDLATLDASFAGSLTPPGIYGDYMLPIYDYGGTEVVTRLFMWNSGGTGIQQVQVDQYKNLSESLAPSRVASLGFIHIPLPEMMEAYNYGEVRGSLRDLEGICCHETQTTFFDTLVEQDEIKIITSGHDHGNDFVARLDGIQLAYGKKTGSASYNSLLSANHLRVWGGRVYNLQLSQDTSDQPFGAQLYSEYRTYAESTSGTTSKYRFTVHSWIRLTNGKFDEQLKVREDIASQLMVTCCVGPTDVGYYIIVWVPVGVGLFILAVIAVAFLICWRKLGTKAFVQKLQSCCSCCCCSKSAQIKDGAELEILSEDSLETSSL